MNFTSISVNCNCSQSTFWSLMSAFWSLLSEALCWPFNLLLYKLVDFSNSLILALTLVNSEFKEASGIWRSELSAGTRDT